MLPCVQWLLVEVCLQYLCIMKHFIITKTLERATMDWVVRDTSEIMISVFLWQLKIILGEQYCFKIFYIFIQTKDNCYVGVLNCWVFVIFYVMHCYTNKHRRFILRCWWLYVCKIKISSLHWFILQICIKELMILLDVIDVKWSIKF